MGNIDIIITDHLNINCIDLLYSKRHLLEYLNIRQTEVIYCFYLYF